MYVGDVINLIFGVNGGSYLLDWGVIILLMGLGGGGLGLLFLGCWLCIVLKKPYS